MPTISTPTQALAAEKNDNDQQMGQRFSFAGVPGQGAGDGQPQGDPEPPALDLPRVQTQVERPERDTGRRDLMRLVQGLGAAGALAGAAGDSPLSTSVGAGLAQGANQAQTRAEDQFQRDMQAYEEFLRSAREENRARRRSEAEADFDAALQDYQLDRQARQGQRQHERTLEEMRVQDELDQPTEEEKALDRARRDYYEARADDERRPDRDENALPDDPQQIERELRTTNRQIQAMRSRYEQVPTNTFGEPDEVRRRQIGRQIDSLIRQREALKSKQQSLQGSGQQPGSSGGQRIPQEDRIENRDTVFTPQGGPSAAAPGRQSQPSAPSDTPASGQDTRQRRDASDQVPQALRERIMQQIPEGDSTRVEGHGTLPTRQLALNAAALVESDTTSLTPARFKEKFGFNPFQ